MMSKKFYGGREFTDRNGKVVYVSPYIEIVDQDTVRVKTSDFQGTHVTTVKRSTRVAHEAGSGYMQIGGIGGDWRQMQALGEELEYIFEKLEGSEVAKRTRKVPAEHKKHRLKDVS